MGLSLVLPLLVSEAEDTFVFHYALFHDSDLATRRLVFPRH